MNAIPSLELWNPTLRLMRPSLNDFPQFVQSVVGL